MKYFITKRQKQKKLSVNCTGYSAVSDSRASLRTPMAGGDGPPEACGWSHPKLHRVSPHYVLCVTRSGVCSERNDLFYHFL